MSSPVLEVTVPGAWPSKLASSLTLPEEASLSQPSLSPQLGLPSSISAQLPDDSALSSTSSRSVIPEGPSSGPRTGQPVGVDEAEGEQDPQASNSPPASRPISPMSIDSDGIPENSALQDVDETEAEDLSHLGKLRLKGLSSHGVHRVWLNDLPDDHPPQPNSHFPSKNPWPTANFTAVKGTWGPLLETSPSTQFPLPSGRPTPVPTPSTVLEPYVFSSSSSRVRLCEPSNVGLVYPRRYLGDIITLGVGPTNVEFHIHREILRKASPVFSCMFGPNWKEASEGRARLDEDDPNAWSLIADWLYCGTLPPFKPVWALDMASSVTVKGSKQNMKRIPLPSYFGPPVSNYSSHRSDRGVHIMRLGHLCTQPFYEPLSADELRLMERHMDDGEFAARYFYYLQSGTNILWSEKPGKPSQRDGAIATPSLTEQQHKDMYHHLTKNERIPVPVPFPGFVEAEFLQVTLVKVMILAHKYALDNLFNDAIDMYRRGEKELERRHPVIRHIELAYAFCLRGCPLVTLLADMAAFSAKLNTMAPEVLEFATQCVDFSEDLAARHDARVGFPGFDRRRDVVDVFQSPLNGGKDYHVKQE